MGGVPLNQEGRTETIGEQMAYDYRRTRKWCGWSRLTGNLAVPVELAVFSIFQASVCYGLANSLFFRTFAFLVRRSTSFGALMQAQ